MEKFFIIANWKSNKTTDEAIEWLREISKIKDHNLKIILCAPFTALYPLKLLIEKSGLPIKLGAQDISPFPDGAYTGEISARMLKDLGVGYVLVGHSERRRYFGETDIQVAQKVRMALDFEIIPIVCVGEFNQFINILNKLETKELAKIIFMLEPPGAISVQTGPVGQGEAESVQNVIEMIKKMKKFTPVSNFFYGGSVKSHNITNFLSQPEINGVVPGTASQNAQEFIKMIENAAKI